LSSLKGLDDNPASIVNIYVSKEYLGYDFVNDRKNKIQTITKEEVIALAKKIHPDTIFILEGSI